MRYFTYIDLVVLNILMSNDNCYRYIGEYSSLLASAKSLPEVAAPKSKVLGEYFLSFCLP